MTQSAPIDPSRAASEALVLVVAIVGGVVGLGWIAYFFFGQWQKGVVSAALVMIPAPLILVFGVLTCGLAWLLLPIYVVLLVPLVIANVIDAHLQNRCLRQGFAIGQWTLFDRHL
jgi:hypothetical protein